MKKTFYAYLHWAVIIFAYTAFIWLDWRLLLIGVLIYWLQILVFKACVLSIAQYGDKETSFVATHLNNLLRRFGWELPAKNIRFFLDWILPIIFLASGYVLQNYFNVIPLVKL